jgi:4-oxalocrotonate tautomerase
LDRAGERRRGQRLLERQRNVTRRRRIVQEGDGLSGPPADAPPPRQHAPKNWRFIVPLVQVKLIEGVFSHLQKRQMIEKLTEAMVSIEGENMRQVTWVVIEEVPSGEWGIGGQPMTTADVKALAAGGE